MSGRWAMRGDARLPLRFWEKVDINSEGCWRWQGSKSGSGYGSFWWNGRLRPAHRVSYEVLIEEPPSGLELDHLCRRRDCVNPAHLEPVTRSENILRGDAPARQRERHRAVTHCPRGHEYTADNTAIATTTRGVAVRRCRACDRERARDKRAALAAERGPRQHVCFLGHELVNARGHWTCRQCATRRQRECRERKRQPAGVQL